MTTLRQLTRFVMPSARIFNAIQQLPQALTQHFVALAGSALVTLAVLSASVQAAVPVPGSLVSNTASATFTIGTTTVSLNSNTVVATVSGGALALSKKFDSASIISGTTTPLTFLLTNSGTLPAHIAVAFTDTLPSGLMLSAGATAAVTGAGCTGTVLLTAPATIAVSNFNVAVGTAACSVTVNGITNRANQLNASCATNPSAFTNSAASISGILVARNDVTNQCLLVTAIIPVQNGRLDQTQSVRAFPGDQVFLPHRLTNGPLADTYNLVTDNLPGTFDVFDVQIFLDADNDGRPDSATPITGPFNLAPNQVLNFVIALRVPTNAVVASTDQVRITAVSTLPNRLPIVPNLDTVTVQIPAKPDLSATVAKIMRVKEGGSPSGDYEISLRYSNNNLPEAIKTNFTLADTLPTGMQYVPGSGRWTAASGVVLTDAADRPGQAGRTSTILYDFGVTLGNTVTAVIATLNSGDTGEITFSVRINPNLPKGTLLANTATFSWTDKEGVTTPSKPTNTEIFTVTGKSGVTLTGQTIEGADPGSTVTFTNVLTNTGDAAENFDITLVEGNYPPGTTFELFRPDGSQLLRDTNGNGILDTGLVPAGGVFNIIVKAKLPAPLAVGGPFKITKTAQAISNPTVNAKTDDVLKLINRVCRVILEPDNVGTVTPGASIVYRHVLTNTGNCLETITFPANFLTNDTAAWAAEWYIDNPDGRTANADTPSSAKTTTTRAKGAVSNSDAVGFIDASDTRINPTTTFTIAPGAKVRFLVKVISPANIGLGQTNVTVESLDASATGRLSVKDTTTTAQVTAVIDIIQPFVDPRFTVPTLVGYIGRNVYLRAAAPSCNALPDIIESRIIIITGPNGEREEVVATETGPNTGIFVAEGLPIRNPPVTVGNIILEGNQFDVYDIEIIGCGRKITTTLTLIDPNGVVFDSRTNQPIAGATVTLVNAINGQCTTTPARVQALVSGRLVSSPSTVVTGIDGKYDFPLVTAGDFCLLVTPPNGYTFTSIVPASQLPAGRTIFATGPITGGSYGGSFRVGPETGPVTVDIPVDGGALGGLFIQKTVLRSTVEIGEFADYSAVIRNSTGYALNLIDVIATDILPAGFSYVAGSAQLEGKAIADPVGGAGPTLMFNIGRMAVAQSVRLSYRVRVGPSAAQGDGINRISAAYQPPGGTSLYAVSNTATARVTIVGGVFSDKAYIIGKVFANCAKDGDDNSGVQNLGDLGIPGVRIYLEDGTNVISDAEGKYSFYGLNARTRVLKIDTTSLPKGSKLLALSNRNLGDPESRFADLKFGELHKADFAISNCEPSILAEINDRRSQAASDKGEVDGRLKQRLEADPSLRLQTDIKTLPAKGVLGENPVASEVQNGTAFISSVKPVDSANASEKPVFRGSSASDAVARVGFSSLAPSTADVDLTPVNRRTVVTAPTVPLEESLVGVDNRLGFIGLKDGDTLSTAQGVIRVKGIAGATLSLKVNDKVIEATKIGKRSSLEAKQLQALEFVGVDLQAGANTLVLSQVDSLGIARGSVTLKINAPGPLAKIMLTPAFSGVAQASADGQTPFSVTVAITDKDGVPITARSAITLSIAFGRISTTDLNDKEPGVQIFVEGGKQTISIVPPSDPGQGELRAESGTVKAALVIDYLPELRQMIAAGVIEGVLNLRKLDASKLTPTRTNDGFEDELRHIHRQFNDGKRDLGVRAAMFLKGKVKGEYLLTLGYDSEKNTRDRLFRDIQPDEFYPVYGDSVGRGFDAQSTGRLYVRVDNKKSYALYGDYNTAVTSEATKLAIYNRSLTGLKHHFENKNFAANVYASRDTTRQIVDEIPANGTSGPFALSIRTGVINGEKLEIITRSRDQSAIIVKAIPLGRFVDYELEPLTGRIILKAPVPSFDDFRNPNFIRITYEVDQGGKQFWVYGGDLQVKINESIQVGASYARDDNPLDKFRMAGINTVAKLADRTFLIAEIARTDRDNATTGKKDGTAKRIEFKHQTDTVDLTAYAGRADVGFDNAASALNQGRSELGGKLSYKLSSDIRVAAEALRSEDIVSGSVRDGFLLSAEKAFANQMRVEVGIRHAKDSQTAQVVGAEAIPNEVTALRGRVSSPLPFGERSSAFLEAEVDTKDSGRKILAVGGEYELPNKGRLYARHEFISSLTGPYGLSSQQRQNATVFGINTDYMKDGNVFSEYRIRDSISGGNTEAALGLRNTFNVGLGLKLQTGFEKIHSLRGAATNDNTAVTLGLEYLENAMWKGSTRLELRTGTNSDSWLSTIALASKLNRDWTLLGRNTYSLIKNKGLSNTENEQDRLQVGVAYRDTETDVWNGLARVEHRTERNTADQVGVELKRTVEIASLHANWQPIRPFTFSGRYAAKWVKEQTNGLNSRYQAQLLSGRVIWEVAPRWDASLQASTLYGSNGTGRQYGLGLELGYRVLENLWLSGGYNFFGYNDADLTSGEYTNKGVYLRMRYKFDEDLFSKKPAAAPAAPLVPVAPAPLVSAPAVVPAALPKTVERPIVSSVPNVLTAPAAVIVPAVKVVDSQIAPLPLAALNPVAACQPRPPMVKKAKKPVKKVADKPAVAQPATSVAPITAKKPTVKKIKKLTIPYCLADGSVPTSVNGKFTAADFEDSQAEDEIENDDDAADVVAEITESNHENLAIDEPKMP